MLVVLAWMAPLEIRDWFHNQIDTRAFAVMMPVKIARDNDIKLINMRIDSLDDKATETNSFVKAMALEQLGAKRFEQVKLTTGHATSTQ